GRRRAVQLLMPVRRGTFPHAVRDGGDLQNRTDPRPHPAQFPLPMQILNKIPKGFAWHGRIVRPGAPAGNGGGSWKMANGTWKMDGRTGVFGHRRRHLKRRGRWVVLSASDWRASL